MKPASARACGLVLGALCLVLGAALLYQRRVAVQDQQRYLVTINQVSNRWQDACLKLNEQKLVNLSIERDLSTALENATDYSNRLSRASEELRAAKDAKPAPTPEPDPRLAEWQDERDLLTTKLSDLTSALAKLDAEMLEANRKLQAAEGDRDFLMLELKRLQSDRAALMRQFTDIKLVREQLHKLKAEQAVSRRLASIRRGSSGAYKGAELLHKRLASSAAPSSFDLNVEIRRNEGEIAAGTPLQQQR